MIYRWLRREQERKYLSSESDKYGWKKLMVSVQVSVLGSIYIMAKTKSMSLLMDS